MSICVEWVVVVGVIVGGDVLIQKPEPSQPESMRHEAEASKAECSEKLRERAYEGRPSQEILVQ